ncbi:mitochondrial ribosomal protein L18 [Xylocopa sonorina]|uniref:mitochondrial ribosomal protein L18 n=1 Tax=Xylocopa sonorina TaxID=1818115 RepID=UPI00403AC7BC
MSRICLTNLLIKRQMHGNAELVQNCKEIRNRNPRNLERLRIARKPIGYGLDKPVHQYWHKLIITTSQRFVTAEICHFENGPVLKASTQEWGLRTHLKSTNDAMAYKLVGLVLAQRCLESGISEIHIDKSFITGKKIESLVDTMSENGIALEEPQRYKHPQPAFRYRPEKPWESFE